MSSVQEIQKYLENREYVWDWFIMKTNGTVINKLGNNVVMGGLKQYATDNQVFVIGYMYVARKPFTPTKPMFTKCVVGWPEFWHVPYTVRKLHDGNYHLMEKTENYTLKPVAKLEGYMPLAVRVNSRIVHTYAITVED